MTEVQIRPVHEGEPMPMDLLLLADPSREVIETYIHRSQCFVAVQYDKIIGVLVLLHTRPQTIELVNVAVSETEQGQGIGTQLVQHAISTARQNGYKVIGVGTGNSSLGQLALYQKCGFRMTGIDRDFFTLHYPQPIYENGILCRDMIRLAVHF